MTRSQPPRRQFLRERARGSGGPQGDRNGNFNHGARTRENVRREKLGIDPTLQATALDLNPVPIPACNSEACAFGGCPKNRPVCRWRRPDVYAGTLQQNGISLFGASDSLALRII